MTVPNELIGCIIGKARNPPPLPPPIVPYYSIVYAMPTEAAKRFYRYRYLVFRVVTSSSLFFHRAGVCRVLLQSRSKGLIPNHISKPKYSNYLSYLAIHILGLIIENSQAMSQQNIFPDTKNTTVFFLVNAFILS